MESRLLFADYLNNKGRPIHKMMHYFGAYERHFGRFVGHPVSFLEIGAGDGGSSQMWKRWFGPLARVVTVDINPACKEFEDEQVSVRIGEPSDPVFLQELIDEFGVFDLVVDDGSHQMAHVLATISYLYPRISPNGVYMVEDVHTAYWDEYGGGLNRPDTIVSFFKDAVDRLNADHVRDGNLVPDGFTRSTFSISAYDSLLVFEKAAFINKHNFMIGDPNLRLNY
jgi:cephalosporin hydroxylase